jgi:hypothetical protein
VEQSEVLHQQQLRASFDEIYQMLREAIRAPSGSIAMS